MGPVDNMDKRSSARRVFWYQTLLRAMVEVFQNCCSLLKKSFINEHIGQFYSLLRSNFTLKRRNDETIWTFSTGWLVSCNKQGVTVFAVALRRKNATAHSERQCENVLSDTESRSVMAVPSVPPSAVITGS